MPRRSYVPILKWKTGERNALSKLVPADRDGLIPLAELLPDDDNAENTVISQADAERFAEQVQKSWGSAPIFVDPVQLAATGTDYAELLHQGRLAGISLVPTVWLTTPNAVLQVLAPEVKQDGRGVCLRLDADAVSEHLNSLAALGRDTMVMLGLGAGGIDLLLDWGSIDSADIGKTHLALSPLLPAIVHQGWRSVTFAASAFPRNLAEAGVGTSTIARAEWAAYSGLLLHAGIAFGDYAIAHPEYAPAPFLGSAAIRYTIQDEWLIVRGRLLTRPQYGGFSQFHSLCSQLVADRRFCGAGFSWGDDRILQCSRNQGGPGNLTTWRQVGTNHHLAFAVRQVANLPASSGLHAPPHVGP